MPKKPPQRNGSTMGTAEMWSRPCSISSDLVLESRAQWHSTVSQHHSSGSLESCRSGSCSNKRSGLVVTNFRRRGKRFELVRPSPTEPDWPTVSQERWQTMPKTAQHDNGINEFLYTFTDGGLSRITIRQRGVEQPTFEIHLQPALPDVRRAFDGTHRSSFLMDVNGERGHGTGHIDVKWEDTQSVTIAITPTAPWWLADRPMQSTIRFNDDGTVDVPQCGLRINDSSPRSQKVAKVGRS